MRWLALAGLLLVSCGLPPQPEPVAPISDIFRDFPELAEWGHVVRVGLRDYWQPDPALCERTAVPVRYAAAASIWVPYGNGYFYDDAALGLVWVSQDPWGFITEHYGYWRHHAQLGYVWRPFAPLRWRPFVASVLRTVDGRFLGLCPFDRFAWENGLYEAGFGFDDDYWAAYWGAVASDGFYDREAEHFVHACVTVALHDAAHDWRDAPDAHAKRDLEYRDRRGHRTWNEEPRQEEARQQPSPAVETGRESRPAESAPRAPADRVEEPRLPSIPARDLEVKRPATEAERRPALQTKELRTLEPRQPVRAESTTAAPGTRPVAAPAPAAAASTADSTKVPARPKQSVRAATVKKTPAAPAAGAKDSAATRDANAPAVGAKDSAATRDASVPAKKATEGRKQSEKKSS